MVKKIILMSLLTIIFSFILIYDIALFDELKINLLKINTGEINIYLIPLIDVFILLIHYIFCHIIPLNIMNSNKSVFNLYRYIRGFLLIIIFFAVFGNIVNGYIFDLNYYNSTFQIIIFFYLLHMLIGMPIIENNVLNDVEKCLNNNKLRKYSLYSVLMLFLTMLFYSFLYMFILFRKNSPSMGFLGFVIALLLFAIYTTISITISFIVFAERFAIYNKYILMITNKFFLIIYPFINIYFLIISYAQKSTYLILVIFSVLLSIINFIANMATLNENKSYNYVDIQKSKKAANLQFEREFEISVNSSSGSYSNRTSRNSSNAINANKKVVNSTTNNKISENSTNSASSKKENSYSKSVEVKPTKIEEIYVFENAQIRYTETNPHKNGWGLPIFDYVAVGHVYFKSNLGNIYDCCVNVIYRDCDDLQQAKRIFMYNNESTMKKKYKKSDFVHVHFF